MILATHRRLLTAGVALLLAGNVQPFTVGQYRLGMSNTEAAKIGLNACVPLKEQQHLVACDGVRPELPAFPHPDPRGAPPGFSGPYLIIDARTKKVVRIAFSASYW